MTFTMTAQSILTATTTATVAGAAATVQSHTHMHGYVRGLKHLHV